MSTAAQENSLVRAALEYAGYGWRVIPLHNLTEKGCSCNKGSSCATPGKHPRPNAWQKAATTDEEVIAGWWEKWPKANVGVVFGRDSGIVDAECDSGEEEDILRGLFGGEIPPTISFKSSRGRHWLFKWRDDLPPVGVHHCGKLAIRLGCDERGAMSVFPPSIHPSGLAYQWVLAPADCDLAEISDEALARIVNYDGVATQGKPKKTQEHWERILKGVGEGERNDSMVSLIGKMLRNTVNITDDTEVNIIWNNVVLQNERNSPPLEIKDLRSSFTSILKAEENRRANMEAMPHLPHLPEDQTVGKDDLEGFKLVIVRSDPPLYELHATQFRKAENSCLVLDAKTLNSPAMIRIAALEQAEYPLPRYFQKMWDGHKSPTGFVEGLYAKLVRNAEHKEAPPEQKRKCVVAGLLLEELERARTLGDGKDPPKNGMPVVLQSGDIVFRFVPIYDALHLIADKVTRRELSELLDQIGAKEVRFHGRKRFVCLDSEATERLKIRAAEA